MLSAAPTPTPILGERGVLLVRGGGFNRFLDVVFSIIDHDGRVFIINLVYF